MKRSRPTLLALLTAGLLAVPTVALAGPGKDGACFKERRAAKLQKFDQNKDGILDAAERKRARLAKRKAMLATYDQNGDNVLSGAERQTMRADRQAKRFAKLDKNRDGAISKTEATGSRLTTRFDTLDADKSGNLSPAEMAAAKRGKRGWHKRGKHQSDM